MKKRLCKDTRNKSIAGVCAGIANYLELDPTVIRVLWVLFCLVGGSGLLAYIICAVIMPADDSLNDDQVEIIDKDEY